MYSDQPIGFGDRKPRELIPAGWHECAITGIYNVGRQYDDFGSKKLGKQVWRTIIKIKFESAQKRADGKPVVIFYEVTGSMDSRSRLRAIAHAIEGRNLTEQEAAGYRLSQMLGKPVMVNVTHVEKKNQLPGSPPEMKDKVNAIVPTISPYTPTVTPEMWDWRGSDPDDAPDWVWELYRKSQDYREPAKPRVPKPRGELGAAAAGVVAGMPSTPVSQPAPAVSGIDNPPF